MKSFEFPPFFISLIRFYNSFKKNIKHYDDFIANVEIKDEENILVFGSGWGSEIDAIIRRDANVNITGIDTSHSLTAYLKNLYKFNYYVNIVDRSNKDDRIDKDDKFDLVVIHNVLHEIKEEERKDAIDSLKLLLKPDGKILIQEPLPGEKKKSDKEHGMTGDDIDKIMNECNMKKTTGKTEIQDVVFSKYEAFTGVYEK